MDVEYNPANTVNYIQSVSKLSPSLTPPCKGCDMQMMYGFLMDEDGNKEFYNIVKGFSIENGRTCNGYCFANLGNVLMSFMQNLPRTIQYTGEQFNVQIKADPPNSLEYHYEKRDNIIYIILSRETVVKAPVNLPKTAGDINYVVSSIISRATQRTQMLAGKEPTEVYVWKTFGGDEAKLKMFFAEKLAEPLPKPISPEIKLKIEEEAARRTHAIKNVVRERRMDTHLKVVFQLRYLSKLKGMDQITLLDGGPVWSAMTADTVTSIYPAFNLLFDATVFFSP